MAQTLPGPICRRQTSQNAKLSTADLTDADLTETKLVGIDLSELDLSEEDLAAAVTETDDAESGTPVEGLRPFHLLLYIGGCGMGMGLLTDITLVDSDTLFTITMLDAGVYLALGAFLADARQLKASESDWAPSYILGLVGLFVFYLYLPYYALARRDVTNG